MGTECQIAKRGCEESKPTDAVREFVERYEKRIAELEAELQAREDYPGGFIPHAELIARIGELEAESERWRRKSEMLEEYIEGPQGWRASCDELISLVRDMRTVIAVHEGDGDYESGKHFDKRMRELGIEVGA